MKNLLILAFLFLGLNAAHAKDKKPKIDMNDDTVTVDGKALFILDPIKKAKFETKDYFIKDLSGKRLAMLQSDCYEDPTRPNPERYKYQYAPAYLSNCYITITFLDTKKTSDFNYYHKATKLADFLIESGLIKDGTITTDTEEEFIMIHGNKNAEEKAQKLGGNTIIINNNSTTIPANGLNININKGE